MSRLAPYDATREATAALSAAPRGTVGGPVRVESRTISMPRTFGEAILTTVTAAGPGVDLRAVEAILRQLPGTQASGTQGRQAFAYRSRGGEVA